MKSKIHLSVFLSLMTFYSSFAQMIDDKIKALAHEIADQIVANGGTKVAVTALDYKNCKTEFGQYLAEELTGYLSTSGKKITVVNQKMLEALLVQNRLTAKGLLEVKNDAAKLGQASGINALVYGTITSLGEDLKVSLSVVRLPTLEVYGFAKSSLSLTNGIKNMLPCITITESKQEGENPEEDSKKPKSNPDCKTKNTCIVCVTNHSKQNIVTYLYSNQYKRLLVNPGKEECWREVQITNGEDMMYLNWFVEINGKRMQYEKLELEACKVYQKEFKD